MELKPLELVDQEVCSREQLWLDYVLYCDDMVICPSERLRLGVDFEDNILQEGLVRVDDNHYKFDLESYNKFVNEIGLKGCKYL